MDKKESDIKIICVYDGKQEASEVFADLIFKKIKEREYIATDQKMLYNESIADTPHIALGLCGLNS